MLEARASLAALPGLRICLLGSPCLSRADGVEHVLERKDAALIAMLARDGPTQRSRVAACLWPGASEAQARTNLRQRLFRLRQQAGCDVVRDDGALRLADDVGLDITESLSALQADAAAAAGELLGAHDYGEHEELERWVAAARGRWRAERAQCIAQRASELEARHEIAAALPYAQRHVSEEPLLEQAHRRLMRLHYLRGDRAAATAAFVHCRTRLRDELGVEPDDETLKLARLIESGRALAQPRPSLRPIGVLRPPRLVGREAPWRRLQAIADGAGAALILGEAGIGKSRLLGDFAATSRSAVACNARPGDASLPFALLARLVRALMQAFGPLRIDWARQELARIVPELGAAPAGELTVLRLQQALLPALTQAREAGLALIAVDDLHFADVSSLELLPALLAAGREMRLPWLMASRASEMPSALRGWLEGDQSVGVERLVLGPLDATSVQAVLESLAIPDFDAAAWAPALTRHTGGNPLFLLETLIALLDRDPAALGAPPCDLPAPARLSELIERRLHQLSPAALRLARLAALAGQNFSVELAAEVLGRHALDIADDWRELETALVIRDDAFAHDLIFEATLHSVPAAIARTMHAEVARVLEHRGCEPARLAHHWARAEQWLKAGACFLEAARQALAMSQRRLEADLALEAARCFASAGDREGEFRAREQLFQASRYVDRYELQAERADDLMRLTTSDVQRAAAFEARAMLANDDQQDEAALTAARAAGALARALGDASRELSVARLEARALSRLNRQPEALELLERCRQSAWSREGDVLGARMLVDLGATLIICDRAAEADPLLQRAINVATSLHDWALCHESTVQLAWSHACQGRLIDSTQGYERARLLKQRFGAEGSVLGVHDVALPRQYKELGRFAEALALLDETLSDQRRSKNLTLVTVTESELVNVWLWLGQTARAAQAMRPPSRDASPSARAGHLLARARVAIWQAQPAVELLRDALALIEREGRAYYSLVLQSELARILPPDEALPMVLEALAHSEALRLHITTWPLKSATCDALRRAGRSADAATLARQIMAEFEDKPPIVRYPPEYWWIAHQALAAAGDDAGAAQALRRAVAWIREVALSNVPDEFRDGFLHRNPVNRAVLAAASRLLPAP